MRKQKAGGPADRSAEQLAQPQGAIQPDAKDASVRALQQDVSVYPASADDGDGRSSGVWGRMGADAILREDARHLANIAEVSIDKMQRELGVITRTKQGDIDRNEIQMAEVSRADGSVRTGPPVSSKYQRDKEEQAWQRTFTAGSPSATPSSLMEVWMRATPHFGYAPVARVEGTAASPRLLHQPFDLRLNGKLVAKPSKHERTSNCMNNVQSRQAWTTFEQARNCELDVVDFMRGIGQATPTLPAIPSPEVRRLRGSLLDEELTELDEAMRADDLVGIADGIVDSVYVLVGMAIAYGLPFSDLWDEVHTNNMTKVSGPIREDGKRLKPEGYVGPDIIGVLRGTQEVS